MDEGTNLDDNDNNNDNDFIEGEDTEDASDDSPDEGDDDDHTKLLKVFDHVLADGSSNVAELQRILLGWRQGDYEMTPSSLLVAYFLQNKYDLRKGKPALIGEDARKVSFVSTGAADLDYIVCLAGYERFVETSRTCLISMDETTIQVCNIVDINGEPILGESVLKLDPGSVIEPKDIMPEDKWVEPRRFGTTKQWFRGTVLILFHKENVDEVLIRTMKAEDALLELQSSPATSYPTARTKKLARYILRVVHEDRSYTFNGATSMNRDVAEFALNRRDLQLWTEAVTSPCKLRTFRRLRQSDVQRACQVFGLGNVCPSLKVVYSDSTWDEWIAFVCDMPTYLQFVDTAELYGWCKEQVAHRLSIVDIWSERRIPQVMTIARTFGIRCLHAIRSDARYVLDTEFALGMIERLHIDRHEVFSSVGNQVASNEDPEDPSGVTNASSSPEQVLCSIIYRWISNVFDQLLRKLRHPNADDKYNDYDPDHYDGHSYSKRATIVERIPRCFRIFMVVEKDCQGALDDVLKLPGDDSIKLQDIYIPLVRDLAPLLREFKHDVNSPSFAPFFRHVVELYSRLLLGSRTRNPQLDALLRRIDMMVKCDCHECVQLNAFMKQLHVPQRTFLVSRLGLRHFTQQIRAVPKLANYQKLRSERGCCIKILKSDVFAEHRWDVRVKRFREFLHLIGDDDAIEELMGDEYHALICTGA